MRGLVLKYSPIALLILLGLSLLFFDFVSKAYIYHVFPYWREGLALPVFHNVLGIDFAINLAFNRGAAWGVFANFQTFLLIVRILLIFGLFVYLFFFNRSSTSRLPLVLILAGAIGNVVDFFLYGFVIDFFQFNLWGYHFPVFNLADTWITIGVAWLFILSFFKKKQTYA